MVLSFIGIPLMDKKLFSALERRPSLEENVPMIEFLPAGFRLKNFKNCSEVLFVQEVLRLQILVYSLCLELE